jgi:hypothetical protein
MRACLSVAVLTAVLALANGPAFGEIRLQSRSIQPSAGTTTEFLKALKAAHGNAMHGIATFSRIPGDSERAQLVRAGITILAPFQGTSYRVRVEEWIDIPALRRLPLEVQLTALAAEDRVAPPIWRGDFARYATRPQDGKPGNYVLAPDGTLNLTVRMYPGVAEARSRALLGRHALSYAKRGGTSWNVVVARTSLRLLAESDAVLWVGPGPLPLQPENDRARVAINVDALQTLVDPVNCQVLGATGDGVQVGLFDFGMDDGHADLIGRVIRKDIARKGAHATHEAATVAGSGVRSSGRDSENVSNGGANCQWRGIAPGARLIDADAANGVDGGIFLDYITNNGMDLSNHSYQVSADGNYGSDDADHDAFIRGDGLSGSAPVPARLQVMSAGNNGQSPLGATGNQLGYFSISKQTKNALVVGNWDLVLDRIDETSSLGPAHDGRIKPDVVTPGRTLASTAEPVGGVKSAGYCSMDSPLPECLATPTFLRKNFYHLYRGTSMASAATTGSIALVLEKYAAAYGVSLDVKPPLPSTLRGVMIHTARDKVTAASWSPGNEDGAVQATKGPDFVTGWGLIDAQAAVNVVAGRQLVESKLPIGCSTQTYLFTVPPGASGTVRVTLAWDDIASDPAEPDSDSKLVNDLDLVLIDPGGVRHYPWQLNQKIVDAAGNGVPDAAQVCGTSINVQRQYTPVANPNYLSPGHSLNVNDSLPAAGIPQAVAGGRDHLNNVEVVDAPAMPGTWMAQVSGFHVPMGPQSYSLIGVPLTELPHAPPNLCKVYPKLCATMRIRQNLCERYPKLCAPRINFPKPGHLRVGFSDGGQKIVLPMDLLCKYAIDCPACGSGTLCPTLDFQLRTEGTAMRAAVYSSQGRLVKRDATASPAKRLRFYSRPGEQYVLVLAP